MIVALFRLQRFVPDISKKGVPFGPLFTIQSHFVQTVKGITILTDALEDRNHLDHSGNDVWSRMHATAFTKYRDWPLFGRLLPDRFMSLQPGRS